MAEQEVGAKVSLSEHLDTAIVMLILIALFTAAFFAVGRAAGNRFGWTGVTTFFGG
jgi:hypothetical protein